MTEKIIEALQKLDTTNDNHWTADGLPRIDTVKMLASDQTLTRDTITAAAPNFTRSNGDLSGATVTPISTETTNTSENSGTASQGGVQDLAEGLKSANQAVQDTFNNPEIQAGIEKLADGLVVDNWDELHEAASEKQAVAQKAYNDAKIALDEANRELDLVLMSMPGSKQETTTEAIQGYLQAQQRDAENKSRQLKELEDSGVSLESVRNLLGQAENIKALNNR